MFRFYVKWHSFNELAEMTSKTPEGQKFTSFQLIVTNPCFYFTKYFLSDGQSFTFWTSLIFHLLKFQFWHPIPALYSTIRTHMKTIFIALSQTLIKTTYLHTSPLQCSTLVTKETEKKNVWMNLPPFSFIQTCSTYIWEVYSKMKFKRFVELKFLSAKGSSKAESYWTWERVKNIRNVSRSDVRFAL